MCQLEGIVSMPSDVFRPYASAATAVLIFIDGKGDIPDIIEQHKKRREESPTDRKSKCFFVPYSELKENDWKTKSDR